MALAVKDSMVLIHLANADLLDKSCELFGRVMIPEAVYSEVKQGGVSLKGDVTKIEAQITSNHILIRKIRNPALIKRANEFNIYRGEAEALALYWEEQADWLASDDDNLRKKRDTLSLNLIGTPAIIIRLLRNRKINNDTYLKAVRRLKETAWFSSAVFDVMLMEVG